MISIKVVHYGMFVLQKMVPKDFFIHLRLPNKHSTFEFGKKDNLDFQNNTFDKFVNT